LHQKPFFYSLFFRPSTFRLEGGYGYLITAGEDTLDLESTHLYAQGVGVFSQVPKNWEVSLEVVGDEFFHSS
jgi:hypothetical protein